MDLQLDLLDNSYDFLNNALFYYNKANLDDGHEEGQANLETKLFWKTGFILLVQSLELILKESLRRTSDILVYENIDTQFSSDSKTISFQKSVQRLLNLKTNFISTEQKDFILSCGEIRNQFIHYKVKYNSVDIKKKFCKLVELYSIIHRKTKKGKIKIFKYNEYFYKDCLKKAKDFYVFRGIEFDKKELENFKKEIAEMQDFNYCYDKNGNYFERIKYGDKRDFFYTGSKYCPHCAAKLGEYHLKMCSHEICSRCSEQLIFCNCSEGMIHIDLDDKDNSV